MWESICVIYFLGPCTAQLFSSKSAVLMNEVAIGVCDFKLHEARGSLCWLICMLYLYANEC